MQKQVSIHSCKICGQKQKYILRHLKYYHSDYKFNTLQSYYDLFYKQKDEGLCLLCKAPTKFDNCIKNGYRKFCSQKCQIIYWSNKKTPTIWTEEMRKNVSKKRINYFKTRRGKKHKKWLSVSRIGEKNPIHKRDLENWKKQCIQKSIWLKDRIKNGLFTPHITNSWANSKTKLYIDKNRWFRSTWEAVFYILNSQVEYEVVRIPYIDESNNSRIYIVDFVDKCKRILYEIKPSSQFNSLNFKCKCNAAHEWCKNNNFIFKIISDDYFKENVNKINFNKFPQLLKGMKQFII